MKTTRCGGLKVIGLWTSGQPGLLTFFMKVEGLENSLKVDAAVFAKVSNQIANGELNPEIGLYLEDE